MVLEFLDLGFPSALVVVVVVEVAEFWLAEVSFVHLMNLIVWEKTLGCLCLIGYLEEGLPEAEAAAVVVVVEELSESAAEQFELHQGPVISALILLDSS